MTVKATSSNILGRLAAQDRRALVREKAALIFAARGYHGASLQEVAEAIGIRKASLYHYYRSKEDILFDILSFADDNVVAFMARDSQLAISPLARIGLFVEAHVSWHLRHPEIAKVSFRDWAELTGHALAVQVERRRRYSHFLREHIELSRDAGLVPQDVNVIMAANFINGAVAAANIWYNPSGSDRPEEVARAFGRMAIATVSTVSNVLLPTAPAR